MKQTNVKYLDAKAKNSWFDQFFLNWPRASIILAYMAVTLFILAPFYKLMPILLSYAPGLRQNPSIYIMTYGSSYRVFYWSIILISTLLHAIPLYFILGDINKWKAFINVNNLNKNQIKVIDTIRKKCNNIPYYVVLAEVLFPIFAVGGFMIINFATEFSHIHLYINAIKLVLLFFSILASNGIVSFIFAKRICKVILANTDIDGSYPGFRVPFRNSLAMQMILMFIVGIMITSLAGYAKLIEEKGDFLLYINKEALTQQFDTTATYSMDEVKEHLTKVHLYDSTSSTFYFGENEDEYVSDSIPLYKDFKIYLRHLSHKYGGKVHIASGELQGASIKINTDKGPYWVGIKYLVVSRKMVKFFVVSFVALLVMNGLIFFYFSHSISNDISMITNNLNKITEGDKVNLDKRIPVVSNDETGDLVVAFNKVQEMTKNHIEFIQKSETIIREQERLASLGQMIGGIAHNLRTPIMSLAGGLKGLQELIKEYDDSVGNDQVTNDDHHAIAKDMDVWVEKLLPYISYMSDVITTVKDHSVLNTSQKTIKFSIDELVKRIRILTSELMSKNNCLISYEIDVDEREVIEGNITILLQVLQNLIENAIDAYTGKKGDVNLSISQEEDTIVFKVQDFGEGIPEKVKAKLFKEMITTKGSGGTGLGLYISQSRIISNFQGKMEVDSEVGKGTTMIVSIPQKRTEPAETAV